ncbi:MAG: DegT/DnrJ/EryC1/StrS family aminotransferase [Thermodesulfobacteriota bacterium]|nr:DegT/DnrJ/EryC1/StrS family aminotransferase [Thermodesulfobacteriota bacterium]
MKVEFFRHNIEESDIENVSKVLRSVFLTTGPITTEFEGKFSLYTGLKHTVGVNSCTAALHLALLALDIGPGDEVITTPMTFIATATSILHSGARPVFVDVDENTGLLDINQVHKAITRRTKAMMPVHLYGNMVDMKGLRRIADDNGLKIIEDCAHCIEGERDGIRPGQLGDAACYSFYATKNLTCGEGGAVATNDAELAGKLRLLRLHGMSKDAATRYSEYYKHWDMVMLGWKYNMDDIHAALLVGQIELLDGYWQRRNRIWQSYDEAFGNIANVKIPETQGKSARHLYTLWVSPDERDQVLRKIQDKEIGVAVNYRAIHTLTYFSKVFGLNPEDYPIANRIGESTVSLPLYPKLSEHEVSYVIDSIHGILTR